LNYNLFKQNIITNADKKPIATPLTGRMSVAAEVAGTQSIRNQSQPDGYEKSDH